MIMRNDANDNTRFQLSTEATAYVSEESLVSDARARLTPAQMVEQKLVSLLQHAPLPVMRQQSIAHRRPVV